MRISKRKFRRLERRVADLEQKVRSQQQVIPFQCSKNRLKALLEQAVRDEGANAHVPTLRVNINGRKLFEQKTIEKQ